MQNTELWNKLKVFQLDDQNSDFTFSERLARDNKWSHEFSLRVIQEYKKFIYLCCAGYGEITPSDAVDQAWHLHLTYTKSYWIDMCRNTLGRQIHHNPTKGGESERKRYSNDYDALGNAYLKEFGTEAPKDIWPSNKDRFSNINFKRVNLSDYWLIKKPSLTKRSAVVALLPASYSISIYSIGESNSLGIYHSSFDFHPFNCPHD